MIEPDDNSHFFVPPLPHKARGKLSTTVYYPTQKIHTLDEVRSPSGVSFREQTAVLS